MGSERIHINHPTTQTTFATTEKPFLNARSLVHSHSVTADSELSARATKTTTGEQQKKPRQANSNLLDHDLHAAAAVDLRRRTRAFESEQVAAKTPPTTSLTRSDDIPAFLRLEADPPPFPIERRCDPTSTTREIYTLSTVKMNRGEANDACAAWKSGLVAASRHEEDIYKLARRWTGLTAGSNGWMIVFGNGPTRSMCEAAEPDIRAGSDPLIASWKH